MTEEGSMVSVELPEGFFPWNDPILHTVGRVQLLFDLMNVRVNVRGLIPRQRRR